MKFDSMFLVDNYETWVDAKGDAMALQFVTPEGVKSEPFYLTWSCVSDLIEAFVEAKLESERKTDGGERGRA